VYSEDSVSKILTYYEFDVPVSEGSKNRRASYLTESKREKVKETFGGDYEAFLRSCQMKLRLFLPREEKHITRCLELIQRSNQLNLSNTRHKAEEFRDLLVRKGFLCVGMECRDRFGDYGIVGFASVDEGCERPILRDLVLSCRVAQKRVEHTFIEWLAQRELGRGKAALAAELVKTERNQPIRQVFEDLHFQSLGSENGRTLMELPLNPNAQVEDIVAVEADQGL
jgi:FkbH-like protein